MNENEHLQYSIIKFLKEAEDDVNVTSGILQKRFELSEATFVEITFQLTNQRLIGKRDNGNWQILIDGKRKLTFMESTMPQKQGKKKSVAQKNYLSYFTNAQLISGIAAALVGTYWIGYYFGTEKVNMDNVDLKLKIERCEREMGNLKTINHIIMDFKPTKDSMLQGK